MLKFYYLIVPGESQCRIVARFHEGIRKPLENYRNYPDEWKEVGLMNYRGYLSCLDAPDRVRHEMEEAQPMYGGSYFVFTEEEHDEQA